MADGDSKISFDSQAVKLLADYAGLDKRLRRVEHAVAPPTGIAKVRQHWMAILILLLWGMTKVLTSRLYDSERSQVYAYVDKGIANVVTATRDRFYISDGLQVLSCDERIAHGFSDHLNDHKLYTPAFPTRPGHEENAITCYRESSAAARDLRSRLGR